MNKKHIVLFLVIAITSIIGVLFLLIKNKTNSSELLLLQSTRNEEFTMDDYRYYTDNFPSEENVGSFSNEKDLLMKAEEIFIKTYGENVKKQKPYQLFYDNKNEVWLIRGTLQPNTMGGVANMLIKDGTGEVLAIWHDK